MMKPKNFYRQFLINRRHRFIYCYVPKVACTSLKQWFLKVAGICLEDAKPNVHAYLDQNFSLELLPTTEAEELLQSKDYFRFVFLREPHARLVSAYLNKIVTPEGPGLSVLREVQKGKLWELRKRYQYMWRKMKTGCGANYQQGMTFRKFVQYIATKSPQRLDPHWRRQTQILGNVSFDYVGRLENIQEDFSKICQQLGLEHDLAFANHSQKSVVENLDPIYADWSTTQLRGMDRYPTYECFFTPELKKIFQRVYGEDLDYYEKLSQGIRCKHTNAA